MTRHTPDQQTALRKIAELRALAAACGDEAARFSQNGDQPNASISDRIAADFNRDASTISIKAGLGI